MDRGQSISEGYPREITELEARIAREEGASSTADMLPASLQKAKTVGKQFTQIYIQDLVVENGYLRQEILYYKRSREATLTFHNQAL